ncbi:g2347 [Coccomyxa viridis]|uniref:G2347 protein n=1 Tax=Coccomyxa viridis TaxID=1274662 RepID=A0ABP1FP42_9CHLO
MLCVTLLQGTALASASRLRPFLLISRSACAHRAFNTPSGYYQPKHRSTSSSIARAPRTRPQTIVMAAKEAPVGTWETPITSELITSQSIRLGAPVVSGDGSVYWLEGRPTEGGRQVLVRRDPSGTISDATPGVDSGLNVRTVVHEYGGGDFLVGDGAVYFSNFKDQRLYKQAVSPSVQPPEPLTPEGKLRFADGILDATRQRIITVQEDHSGSGEAVNTIAAVCLSSGESIVLASGNDFYSNPRISQDGARLAWVTWNHPNMPWDDTELWVADVSADGSLSGQKKVAGGKDESVMQPLWSPSGDLTFISDRSGFWNLYTEHSGSVKALLPMQAEFSSPAWVFGIHSYQILPDGRLILVYSDPKKAGSSLAILDGDRLRELSTPYSSYGSLSIGQTGDKLVLATVGGSPTQASEVALLIVDGVDQLLSAKPSQWETLRKSSKVEIDEGFLSAPSAVEFPTEGGLTAFMNYYPPKNKDFQLPPGEKPPLLIKIHGGPTSQASTAFSLGIQYWTSRGYAIADVNYGGSTGYGREYRNRLRKNWGIVDVDDCCNAATHLAKEGKADEQRLCISGGSAGGYTTLACLAFKHVFSVGVSHYGVADCELLAQDTHKFESRYLDSLIGPYPAEKELYKQRSPINFIDSWRTPTAFFQGDEDKVVPPNQAVIMYDGLKDKKITTALVMFKGEQHGFRTSNAIRRALDGEFFFYGKVLGMPGAKMPDDLEPIPIANL